MTQLKLISSCYLRMFTCFILTTASISTTPTLSAEALQASQDLAALAATAAARSPLPGLNFPPLRGAIQELSLAAPFSSSVGIMFAYKKAVETFLTESLGKASVTELTCMRDYSSSCPDRWADVGDGVNCLAPEGYAVDGCKAKQALITMTVGEKRLFATNCQVAWPCKDACAMNFDLPCPDGWTVNSQGYCSAPFSYPGPCLMGYYFGYHNQKMKRQWSEICKVRWPCRIQPAVVPRVPMMPPLSEERRIRKVEPKKQR